MPSLEKYLYIFRGLKWLHHFLTGDYIFVLCIRCLIVSPPQVSCHTNRICYCQQHKNEIVHMKCVIYSCNWCAESKSAVKIFVNAFWRWKMVRKYAHYHSYLPMSRLCASGGQNIRYLIVFTVKPVLLAKPNYSQGHLSLSKMS